jgi:hypothetical protein
MLKRDFFEANKADLAQLSKASHGFTRRMKEMTGKTFTNRFFTYEMPTDENVALFLDSSVTHFESQLDREAQFLERKRQLVLSYRREFG